MELPTPVLRAAAVLLYWFLLPALISAGLFWQKKSYWERQALFDFLADLMYPWRWTFWPCLAAIWRGRLWKWRRKGRLCAMKTVTIYTDGACSGNPGPGGWGAILMYGPHTKELSGGEAQRIKLASELSKRSTGKTVYILDEPTTGLHFADVHKLTEILRRLSGDGNTVIVIEHNLDVIKTADYIIDIGPEGGDRGGTVVACGTPEEVARNEKSYTGKYIDTMLKK